MKRPEIKDYFHKKTDLKTVHSEYTKSPHLYSYTSDLDRYIDYLEEPTNKSKPSDKDLISKVKQNLQEINKDKKVTDYNFDLGYSLGFLDGNDFSRQIPELTLDQAIEKVKPNMDKIKDVDAHLNEIE